MARRYIRTYRQPQARNPDAALSRLVELIEAEEDHSTASASPPPQATDPLDRFRRRVLLGVSVAMLVALACIFMRFVLRRG
jgi:hypothetical protein